MHHREIRPFYMQSPLHVAAYLGHLEFTTEILRLKPKLAKQLDQTNRSSALHLSSEEGHLDVVKKLLEVNPNTCFVRDQEGRNPIHVAAINNQLHVLDLLVRMNPFAAQERTNIGETVLHLCVKYAQLGALKYLVNAMAELLNTKDNDGNTILHLAVLAKQPEAVKFLVENKKMQQNAINKNGLTAIDCLIQAYREENLDAVHDKEILQTLKRAKAIKAMFVEKKRDRNGKWLNEKRNTLMVVASLIATMAFQVGVNPPAMVGQNSWNDSTLMIVNTASLVSSLTVVFLLISGLPCKRLLVIVLMISMWFSIATTLWTYFYILQHYSKVSHSDANFQIGAFSFWEYLVYLFIIAHIIRLLTKPAKILVQLVKRILRKWTRCIKRYIPYYDSVAVVCKLSLLVVAGLLIYSVFPYLVFLFFDCRFSFQGNSYM